MDRMAEQEAKRRGCRRGPLMWARNISISAPLLQPCLCECQHCEYLRRDGSAVGKVHSNKISSNGDYFKEGQGHDLVILRSFMPSLFDVVSVCIVHSRRVMNLETGQRRLAIRRQHVAGIRAACNPVRLVPIRDILRATNRTKLFSRG